MPEILYQPKIIQLVAMAGSVANAPRLFALTDNNRVLCHFRDHHWDDISPEIPMVAAPQR